MRTCPRYEIVDSRNIVSLDKGSAYEGALTVADKIKSVAQFAIISNIGCKYFDLLIDIHQNAILDAISDLHVYHINSWKILLDPLLWKRHYSRFAHKSMHQNYRSPSFWSLVESITREKKKSHSKKDTKHLAGRRGEKSLWDQRVQRLQTKKNHILSGSPQIEVILDLE